MRLKSRQYRKIELVPGWLDFANAELMYEFACNREILGAGNVLEVGTFFGKSAIALAYGLNQGETITVVDPFGTVIFDSNASFDISNQNNLFRNLTLKKFRNFYNFAHSKPPIVLVGLSRSILPKLKEKYKIIHIDGGHSYQDVKDDIRFSLKLLAEKSLIIFDDYGHGDYPGVKAAVDEAISAEQIIPIIFLGKLYAATPEFADELIKDTEKYLSGFKVVKNTDSDIFKAKLSVNAIYKEPKKYPYIIRRILTAVLSRI